MNRYEFLANEFTTGLGGEYDISYYDNSPPKWTDMILEDMIHGVMLVNGGNTIKAAGSLVDTKQLAITYAIPTDLNIFSRATQTIDDYFNDLIGNIYEFKGNLIALTSYYRSDSIKTTVNGRDYAIVTTYCTVIFYDNAVLSYESNVKVDGEQLYGILNVVYSNQHSVDGGVFGLKDPEQKNFLNGIVVSLTIDIILRRDDNLHLKLMSEIDEDVTYKVEYFNGFITRTYDMVTLKLDELCQTGDMIKAQIVFGRGD